jgi:hypothetical protein
MTKWAWAAAAAAWFSLAVWVLFLDLGPDCQPDISQSCVLVPALGLAVFVALCAVCMAQAVCYPGEADD